MEVVNLIRPLRSPVLLVRQAPGQVRLVRPAGAPIKLVRQGGTIVFSSGGSDVSYVAVVPILDRQAVALMPTGLVPYDATHADQAYAFVGIALNSADPGQQVQVRTTGEVTYPGGNLTPGQTFIAGASGRWQVSRADGLVFAHKIIRAIRADAFLILQQPIVFINL